MASDTLTISSSYHKPMPPTRKPKLEATKVRSEDELLKFFLHGSYDVQRGHVHACQIEENIDKAVCIKDEVMTTDDKISKSRCMFQETYMINISVKQPDTTPETKQINVRIEKTPSDTQISDEKFIGDEGDEENDDEVSSIFDEEENDEVDSVIFNETNTSISETTSTNLTLADMISKTLTTIPNQSVDTPPPPPPTTTTINNTNKSNKPNNWFPTDSNVETKSKKTSEHKPNEQVIKTPPPTKSVTTTLQTATLTTNINEDKKLFEYLDYLETKEESKASKIISTPVITLKFFSFFNPFLNILF